MIWCFAEPTLRESLSRWASQPGRPAAAEAIVTEFLRAPEAEKLRVRSPSPASAGEGHVRETTVVEGRPQTVPSNAEENTQ